ncbi:hypothetical protein EDD75_0364 [Thermodesulfitimonas autotrophica]|uniref:Uncharacterized protein n=1 Tax=Thermodesulfitimonas autotrophica TaxID=1894989 RepID=A0A3N5AX90_9THEO|nr:hypothetical protein [Thermodesulfitimonas autotrophica]RPF49547.1 hypothetical protein EDD75_0364 [Thermodesulfitimonas autotrophica]
MQNDIVKSLKEVFDAYAKYVRSRAEKRCVSDEESKSPFIGADTELSMHVETLRRLGETIINLSKLEN